MQKDAHPSYQDASREERRNLVTNVLLTLIFISTYSTSMIISELYFPIPENIFMFILLKFIIGLSHHLLGNSQSSKNAVNFYLSGPLAILASQAEIRAHVGAVYRKGGTQQNTTMEMTYEELQRNLGLGVDIG